MPPTRLILASASTGRKALLQRICADFDTCPADIDETPAENEPADTLAARLARQKAEAVADKLGASIEAPSEPIIIGADQTAACDGQQLGKPRNAANNHAMLTRCSGRIVTFYSAVCIYAPASEQRIAHTDITEVAFRALSAQEVERYVAIDQPWSCAGGFKVEQAGVTLFDRVHNDDPTGLIGLPLIFVSRALRQLGWTL